MDALPDRLPLPWALVEETFAACAAASGGYDPAWADAVPARMLAALGASPQAALARVPLLTGDAFRRGAIARGSLVRYVGMVQDVLDPEWYAATVVDRSGGAARARPCAFRDLLPGVEVAGASANSDGGSGSSSGVGEVLHDTMERRLPVYLVPLPGEMAWARTLHHGPMGAPVPTGGTSLSDAPSGGGRARKRGLGEVEQEGGGVEEGGGATAPPPSVDAKGGSAGCGGGASHPLVFESEPPVLCRVYGQGEDLGAALRVGSMFEVLAIFDSPPLPAAAGAGPGASGGGAAAASGRGGGMEEEGSRVGGGDPGEGADEGGDDWLAGERSARNPPFSLVPRLHALLVRPLPPTFPVLQPPIDASGSAALSDGSTPPIVPFALRSPNAPPPAPPPPAAIAAAASRVGGADAAALQLRLRQAHAQRDALAVTAQGSAIPSLLAQLPLPPVAGVGDPALSTPQAVAAAQLASVRAEVVAFLGRALGGDDVAGEWLLLALIASVTAWRGEGEPPLGKLSLTIAGFPAGGAGVAPPEGTPPVLPLASGASPAVRRLFSAVGALLPRVSLLPLRIENLNGLQFFPRKDPERNRLVPGVLQVCVGTPLLVDETVMTAGKLDASGVANLSALQALVGSSHLPYDFIYHQALWPLDAPTIVLTAGGKSLLRSDIVVHLSSAATAALGSAAPPAPTPPDFFPRARAYLAAVRCLPYALGGGVAAGVEATLIAARKADPKLTPETMHAWLEAARLCALSRGEVELGEAAWARVGVMMRLLN